MTGRPPQSTDLVLGVLTLGIAIAYHVAAAAIPTSQLADAVGPQGLPKVYAVVLAGLSLVLITRALLARRNDNSSAPAGAEETAREAVPSLPQATRRAAGMLLIGVMYIALVPYAGYIVTLAALIVTTTYYQGGRIDGRIAVVGVSGALLLWVLFAVILGIPQPTGVWSSIF